MIFQKLKNLKKLSINVAIGSVLFLSANIAHANGPFLEPGISYEHGKGSLDLPSPFGPDSATIRGVGGLLKAGVHITDIIFFGADGRYSRSYIRNENFNAKADSYNWGLLGGVQMPTPIALRLWGTYIIDGGIDPDEDRGLNLRYSAGNGYRLGAGFKFLIASLNLEYQDIEYDKAMLQSGGPFSSTTTLSNINPRSQTYIVSVSFPIFF